MSFEALLRESSESAVNENLVRPTRLADHSSQHFAGDVTLAAGPEVELLDVVEDVVAGVDLREVLHERRVVAARRGRAGPDVADLDPGGLQALRHGDQRVDGFVSNLKEVEKIPFFSGDCQI